MRPARCAALPVFALAPRPLSVHFIVLAQTTWLYRLQTGEHRRTNPTIVSNFEEVVYKNVKLSVWDLGGIAPRPYAGRVAHVSSPCNAWRCSTTNPSVDSLPMLLP